MARPRLAKAVAERRDIYDLDALFDAAKAASKNAYARYSKFHVGAAILTARGAVHVGCNVENIAYPVGTCAEAAAIAAACVAEGEGLEAVAIAIYAEDEGREQAPCAPCGACRQRILEMLPAATVHFLGPDNQRLSLGARDLLPYAFTFSKR